MKWKMRLWTLFLVTAAVEHVPRLQLAPAANATQAEKTHLRRPMLLEFSQVPAGAAPAPTTAPGPKAQEIWRGTRLLIGYFVLASGIALWLYWIPKLVYTEYQNFQAEDLEGRSFQMYLTYRFNYWMNKQGLAAMGKILLIGVLTLLTSGALMYAAFVGASPVTGLWVCFVWASAASVDPGAPAITGFVGIVTTLGGLVLLAVLLTTISDYFAKQVEASKQGRDVVVEGKHLLLLGHSVQTKQLLEEFALCEADDKPTTVVILASQPKQEVEDEIASLNTDLGDLKLVVRSGKACDKTDLWKVGADSATRTISCLKTFQRLSPATTCALQEKRISSKALIRQNSNVALTFSSLEVDRLALTAAPPAAVCMLVFVFFFCIPTSQYRMYASGVFFSAASKE